MRTTVDGVSLYFDVEGAQLAADVAGLCDRLGIAEPVVFGHSGGGFVALHLALRHPGLARALILCATGAALRPLADDDPPPGLAERASPQAAAESGHFAFAEEPAAFQAAVGKFLTRVCAAG